MIFGLKRLTLLRTCQSPLMRVISALALVRRKAPNMISKEDRRLLPTHPFFKPRIFLIGQLRDRRCQNIIDFRS